MGVISTESGVKTPRIRNWAVESILSYKGLRPKVWSPTKFVSIQPGLLHKCMREKVLSVPL